MLGDPGIKLCVCAPSLGTGEAGEGGGALEPAGGIGWLWGPPDRDVAPCLSPWWDLCLPHWWGGCWGERDGPGLRKLPPTESRLLPKPPFTSQMVAQLLIPAFKAFKVFYVRGPAKLLIKHFI